MIRIDIPGMRTVGGMNTREHWRIRAARVKREKERVAFALGFNMGRNVPAPPLIVTLTRIAPSDGLDPFDNLPSSLKSVVDAVATWLGVDDKDPSVQYEAAQERGPWSVRIEIRQRDEQIERWKRLIADQAPNNPAR